MAIATLPFPALPILNSEACLSGKEPRSERNLFCVVYSYESKGCVISVACRTREGYRRNTKAEASLLWRLYLKLGRRARPNENQSMVLSLPYMVCRVIRCLW